MARFFAMLCIIAITVLICIAAESMPPVGIVSGVCTDAKTGRPIPNADVEIDSNETGDNGSNESNDTSSTDIFSQIPSGWSQGSQSDTDLDLSGHDATPKTSWTTSTDGTGRFFLRSVTAGNYTVTVNASGYDNGTMPLAVAEAINDPVTVTMKRSAPSLSFDTPGKDWSTDEVPSIGLNGNLTVPKLLLKLWKLDVNKAITISPDILLQNQQSANSSNLPASLVKRWTYPVVDADSGGSFYDQIRCTGYNGGRLPAGLYRLSALGLPDQGASDSVIFLITDLAVHGKQYGSRLLLHTVDLMTGKSVPSVSCHCILTKQGPPTVLSEAVSSSDGLCTLSTSGGGEESRAIAVARSGDSVAAMEVNLNSPGTIDAGGGRDTSANPYAPDLRAFIYTDRPVYRPGQTVQIRGISRWYRPGAGFVVPSGACFVVQVTDAQDTVVARKNVTCNQFGTWHMACPLSQEALTGEYTVTEDSADETATGTFAVAAYHKPEYQVSVTFDKPGYIRGDTIVVTVTGTYYFGAPMSGASGSIDYYSKPTSPSDDDDDDSSDSGNWLGNKTFKLDGNGQAKITIDTSSQDPSLMQATYTASATVNDNSGQDVTSQSSVNATQGNFSIVVTPSSTVANVGDDITFNVQAMNTLGTVAAGKQLKAIAAYDVWQDDQDVFLPISSSTLITAADGTASFAVRAKKSGLIDVKLSGEDSLGNTVTSDTQVWVPNKDADIPAQYSDLSIALGKARYSPGDTAQVLITTSHPGPDALLTVEGTTLYQTVIIPLTRRAVEVDIPVKEIYAPGVTVAVDCIVGKQFLSNSESLVIDDPERSLNLTINTDRPRYHPGDEAHISIHTSNSHGLPESANVSLAVVDEAIYSIMPEPAETITDAFLPAQNDDVVDCDSTETVYYGDVDKGSTQIDIRRRFPDTALWLNDLMTDKFGNAHVDLRLPDNLTKWRITSYGQTMSTMVGKGTGEMTVNKDLSVSLVTPPFLVAGDHSTIIAMVHNNTGRILPVHLTLSPGGLDETGALDQDFNVEPSSPAVVSWPITTQTAGDFNPEVTVQSTLLSDGTTATIPALPLGNVTTTWNSGSLDQYDAVFLHMKSNFMLPNTQVTIRLSPTVLSSLPSAAEYLSSYPYGCSDSTASALIADCTLISAGHTLKLSPEVLSDLKDKANRALLRCYREQNDDGGWGWFSVDQSQCWMTAYATYGLTLAKKAGLSVNGSIDQAALKATAQLANTERSKRTGIDTGAIALSALVLAENGEEVAAEGNLGSLRRYWAAYPEYKTYEELAEAAIAEHALGTRGSLEQASRMMAELWSSGRETGGMLSWTMEFHSDAQAAGEYYPNMEATAWALLAAEMITPDDRRIFKAAQWLAANRTDDYWSNVDTTGIVIISLSNYANLTNELSPYFDTDVSLNGKRIAKEHFDSSSIGIPDSVLKLSGSELSAGNNLLEFTKTGRGRLYYSVTLSQMLPLASPKPPPSFIETEFNRLLHPMPPLPTTASGYRIKRIFMRLTSRRNFLWEDTVPTPAWEFETGDSILVRLVVDSIRPGSRIVIDEPVPSGCRIAEVSGEDEDDWSNWWDYTDVRDSDIVFFVSNLTAGRHEIDYHLVAERPGDYFVMPTNISSMVDPTLNAEGTSSLVRVDGD